MRAYARDNNITLNNLFDVKELLMLQRNFSRCHNVAIMLRIALTLPVTSVVCERYFSTFARLKMVIRSTFGEERPRSLMVCHIHKENLYKIPLDFILNKL